MRLTRKGLVYPQGQFGVLDRKDMDHFPDIFATYEKMGHTQDKTGKIFIGRGFLCFLPLFQR
jgi:hypothetical protein